MRQEWLYRASTAREDSERTRELAEQHGFIARTPHTDGPRSQMIALVKHVGVADVIHLYFADPESDRGGASLGAYRVVAPHKHPNAQHFGPAVTGTTVRRVAAGPLHDLLRDQYPGYEPDADGVYWGWPVIREDAPSPSYARDFFPTRNSLVRR